MKNTDILLDKDGNPWLTDEDKTVPKKCTICGADVGLFFCGEPIFLCKENNKHYFGTLKFELPMEPITIKEYE